MQRLSAALALVLVAFMGAAAPAFAGFYDLLDAARANDTALARRLIAEGTEPNGGPAGFPDSYAPLMWAAHHGNLDLVRLLLEAGADTERRDFNGDRALLWAASAGQAEAIALLLGAGSPADSPDDPYGQSPLILASRGAWPEAVRVLIEANATIDALDQSGSTALHDAALSQSPETVRLLLAAGADPNIADTILGKTPLHIAAARQEAEIVGALLDAGARTAIRDEAGRAPLIIAAARGLPGNVAALLAAGADPALPDARGLTPLMAAIEGKRHEFADNDAAAALLVPFATDIDGPFVAAAAAGMPVTAMLLLARGADPNAPAVLAFAALLEQPALLDALVAAGADLKIHGPDALVSAASAGRIAMAGRLLDLGVPIDTAGAVEIPPVRAAAEAGELDMLRFLLARGARPVPPESIRLAEYTPLDLFALEQGAQSAALDTNGIAIRERLKDLRRRQLEARAILAAAI